MNLASSKIFGKIINNNLKNIGGDEKVAIGFFQEYKIIDKYWINSIDKLKEYDFLKRSICDDHFDYISMHVRLQDYLMNKKTRRHHGVSGPKYYLDAIKYLYDKDGIRDVKIITDSFKDVKNITDVFAQNKIRFEVVSQDFKSDFLALSLGKSIILSNSSFSWWAAFIANKLRNSTVIAPYPWFRDVTKQPEDLIPKNWVQLERDFF